MFPTAHAPVAPRLRVLVVDDIAASRATLCALVIELGHQAVGVNSGAEALAVLERDATDLVLLDLLMPDMDGFEVTRRIRDCFADRWLPVIVTSSLQGEAHFARALREGADDCLGRPVGGELLDAKLRHYARVLGLQKHLAGLAQRQRAIVDNVLEPVLTLDLGGTVREANRAALQLFGADVVGAAVERVLGAPPEALLAQAEPTVPRADGEPFPVGLTISEWAEDGQLRRTVVLHDLTERRRIDRMKDEFLATVSHELRTPLTSVIGAVSLLAAGAAGALPPQAVSLAEVARRNGERLSRLIDDVLDLTKLEGNQLPLHLRAAWLGQLLQEALAANASYATRAGVNLCGDFSRPGPPVRVDTDRFMQVMANLLSNAIKHSPVGADVLVSHRSGPGTEAVTVRDRGPGIDPRFRHRMFEKFSQADGSDARAQGGTGLGLYITRMLVERMGGRVRATSPTGASGAEFVVELPCATATAAPEPPTPWLLCIARDPDVQRRLARWLEGEFALECVGAVADAPPARPNLPAAVLADPLGLGPTDALCAALRARAAGVPVALCSDAVDAGFASGHGVGWLPAGDAAALVAGVRALLQQAAPMRRPA